MALIDKASLLMVPSTYEAGKLYNVLPSGNRAPDSTNQNSGYDQTRADFDFDRGSNAAATRVNASGLIEKYRENLLLQSNQFDTTWTNNNTTETGGQTDKDGGTDAWLLTKTAAGGYIVQLNSSTNVQTFSVYAKANTSKWIQLLTLGSGTGSALTFFDLENGVIGSSGGSGTYRIDSNIQDVGNGWYRCSITINTNLYDVRIYPAEADNDTSATSGSIYIQNAQLESGLVATDVLTSGATTAKAGVLVDLPRINYDANGENGSLLLEPSRQNLVEQSEYHSSTIYGNQNVSIADNATTSPEGFNNAAKIILDSGTNISNGGHYLSFNSTAGTNYTISVFAKAGEYRYFTFTYGSAAAGGGHFDLQEGTLLGTITNAQYSNESASIEDYGNGWYRLIVSLTDNNTISGRFLSMKPSPSASVPSNNNYSSTGDGTSGAYIYGFQLEANASYPSSYIPTMGTSETRAADSCSVTGVSDVIGQTEGTLFYEFKSITSSAPSSLFIGVSDGTSDNRILIGPAFGQDLLRVVGIFSGASNGGNNYSVTNIAAYNKVAVKYTSSSVDVFINGIKQTSQSGGSFSRTLDESTFDNGTGQNKFEGSIKQRFHFNEALSDAECISLTS